MPVLKRLLILCLLATPAFAVSHRASDFDPQGEEQILQLINKERTERGLGALHLDARLTEAAREHTERMVEHHELTHKLATEPVLSDRVAATGIDFQAAGENVAYDMNVDHAHVEFMHSPGHRANILQAKFNAVGIGVMHNGNLVWVTEDFAERQGTTSASEAASIVGVKYSALRKKVGSPAASERPLPKLGRVACEMAKHDKLDTKSPRSIADVRGVLAWTAADPAKLPEQVRRLADDKKATTYSLGVCYASSASYPNKVFWMVMAIY
ncbi:MAG TPA: CAP domain-containing protein [Candidatus Koribacter sp.]|jgi:uncharacterized protein YkwD